MCPKSGLQFRKVSQYAPAAGPKAAEREIMKIDLNEAAPILEAASKEQKAAESITSLREGLGLTKTAFAELCNCHFESVLNWENGKRRPGGPSIRLLQALDFISRSGLMPEFRKKVLTSTK